jgi:hypothetical protein
VAAVVGVILFVTSVVLALAGVPDAISGPGDVFSNLGRNLITTLAVALLAYVWFSFGTSYSATRRIRREARRRPERLFPVPPRVGNWRNVFGRSRLIDHVATNLRDELRTGPQLIIGESGSGKTSLLLALAAHFARNDVYPIVLSLRGVEEIDFSKMAETRFKEYVDPYVRTAGDADKLWRWLGRRGEIVVLADDLDRARVPGMAADPYKTTVRVALQAAGRRRLPLVVASRPEALPPDLNIAPVAIGPLELDAEAATEQLLARAGRREDDPERDKVRDYIERGNLTANPFYLGLLADVLRLPTPLERAPHDGEHAVRLALLERWRQGLVDKRTVPEGERRRRERYLERLEDFAAARLTPELDATTNDPAAADRRWLSDLHAAERLGLVEMDGNGRHRFKHDVLHAFFAARRDRPPRQAWLPWRKRDTLLAALETAPDAPRVQLSVVFAAAAHRGPAVGRDQGFCREACERLTDFEGEADERRLLLAAAAAEIANAGGFHALDERIAATCANARRQASPVVRRAALEQVARLHGNGVVAALWEFVGDEDYDVRWAAAQKLISRCTEPSQSPRGGDSEASAEGLHAYEALVPIFEGTLRSADGLAKAHDRDPKIMALKHMAWILPALRSPARDWGDRVREEQRPGDLLERLLRLQHQEVSSELGLEASIAQGFKVHALTLITRHEERSNHGDVNRRAGDPHKATVTFDEETASIEQEMELLSRARFWYSQLNLLHAITARVAHTIAQSGGLPGDDKNHVTRLRGRSKYVRNLLETENERHWYVKAAAALCDRITILRRSRYVRGLLQKEEGPHPYIKATAALCDRAIDEVRRDVKDLRGRERENAARDALGRYLWGDEGVLVSQQPAELDIGEVAQARRARTDGDTRTDRPAGLVDSAIQLVGDIVVLLNMNERGDERQRQDFGKKTALPYCMTLSRDRNEVFDKCRGEPECAFGLCPYEPAINRLSAHREISRGFCRHQQYHATRRAGRRWGSMAKRRELREFWEELEAKARM